MCLAKASVWPWRRPVLAMPWSSLKSVVSDARSGDVRKVRRSFLRASLRCLVRVWFLNSCIARWWKNWTWRTLVSLGMRFCRLIVYSGFDLVQDLLSRARICIFFFWLLGWQRVEGVSGGDPSIEEFSVTSLKFAVDEFDWSDDLVASIMKPFWCNDSRI